MNRMSYRARQAMPTRNRHYFGFPLRVARVSHLKRAVPLTILLIQASYFCGLAGCRQGIYTARTLPPELAAQPVIDVQSLDLSRMGGAAIRHEMIVPGDTLQVATITGGEEEHSEPWEVHVGDNGTVDVPLVGSVGVAGLDLLEAENVIREVSMQRRVFRKPTIRVNISERRVNRVTVSGAVNKPDTYELPTATSNLAAALLAAGGLSENADHAVEIRRAIADRVRLMEPANGKDSTAAEFTSVQHDTPANAKHETVQVDLVEAVGTAGANYYLNDGSTVTVKKQPDRFVHLMGLTGNRAIELPPNRNVRILDALAQAGGPRYSIWIVDKVRVIRQVPENDQTVTIKVSIREAKRNGSENILLASGDMLSVEENVVTFTLGTLGQLIGIGSTAATGAATGLAP